MPFRGWSIQTCFILYVKQLNDNKGPKGRKGSKSWWVGGVFDSTCLGLVMENCHTSQDYHHSTCQTGFNGFQGISLLHCPSEQYCIVQGTSFFLTVMVGFHFQVASFYSNITHPHRGPHRDPLTHTQAHPPTQITTYRVPVHSWKMLRPSLQSLADSLAVRGKKSITLH